MGLTLIERQVKEVSIGSLPRASLIIVRIQKPQNGLISNIFKVWIGLEEISV